MRSENPRALWPRVIGQDRVKRTLLSAIRNNRLAHAYLFYGGEGAGKDAVALELARVLQCERGGEEACKSCGSCLQIDSLQHPDVRLVVALPVGKGEQADDPPLSKLPEADVRTIQDEYRRKGANPYYQIAIPRANIIKINSIREVRRESALSTHGRRKRIVIISDADRMGDEAANTLLKTLEEPAGHTMLVLTTARRDALLPTILSRCQNIRFDPLTEEELRTALITRESVDPERALLCARLANGSYTRALALLSDDVLKERQDVLAFIRHALVPDVPGLLADIEAVADAKDRERAVRFLTLTMMWFRDALLLSHGSPILNTDQADELRRFVAKFPHADLLRVLADVEKAVSLVQRNVYIKLAFLQLAVNMKANILRQP